MRPDVLLRGAAALTLLGALGGGLVEALWWCLVPAAIALAAGAWRGQGGGRAAWLRAGAAALAAMVALAVLLTAAGWTVVAVRGYEPAWLSVASGGVAWGLLVALALWAAGLARRLRGLRSRAVVLAGAWPAGLLLDAGLAAALPSGFFLHGVGFQTAAVGFALALLGLARRGAAPRGEDAGAAGA